MKLQSCPLQVFSLPEHAVPKLLSGTVAVAIDILRATTTIITALDSQATAVVPCCSIEQARDSATQLDGSAPGQNRALLGGERAGVLIEGFDLGNSPSSYSPEAVSGQTIVFTTTNGTLAIEACRAAEVTLIGAFVNLSSLCQLLTKLGRPVSLVCAGTDGVPTAEDLLFAGAVCQELYSTAVKNGSDDPDDKPLVKNSDRTIANPKSWNPTARAAWQMWRVAQRQTESGKTLASILCETQGGMNLLPLGLRPDIEFASNIDRFGLVPVVDRASGAVRSDVDLVAERR